MQNRQSIDDDEFEDILADEDLTPSSSGASDHKLSPSTKIFQTPSQIISPEELQAMEIKFDQVEKKKSTLRQQIDSMQRSTSEDVQKLLSSKKQSKKYQSQIIGDEQSPNPKLQKSMRKTSEKESSINIQFNNCDITHLVEGQSLPILQANRNCQKCKECQNQIGILQSELNAIKMASESDRVALKQSQTIIANLNRQLHDSLEREKDLQAEISFMRPNSNSFSVTESGEIVQNGIPKIKPTESAYVQVQPQKTQNNRKVHESFIIQLPKEQMKESLAKQNINAHFLEQQMKKYQLEIKELAEKLETSQEELIRIKQNAANQINRLKDTIKDNSKVIMQLTVEVDDLKTENDKFSFTHTQNTETINSLNSQIYTLKEKIAHKDSLIIEKDSEIAERDNKITETEEKLWQKDELIKEKHQQIRERDEKIKEKHQQIRERDEKIREKHQQIRERDEKIREKEETITEVNLQIQEQDLKIKQKDELIKEKDEQIRQKDEKLLKSTSQSDAKAEIERQLKEKFNQKISELMSQMRILNQQMDTITYESQKKTLVIEQLRQKLETVQNDLLEEKRNKSYELKCLSQKIQELENQIQTLRKELSQIHATYSKLQTELQQAKKDEYQQAFEELTEFKAQFEKVQKELKNERQMRQIQMRTHQQAQFSFNNQRQTLMSECKSLNEQIIYLQEQSKQLLKNQAASSELQSEVLSLREEITALHKISTEKDEKINAIMALLTQAQKSLKSEELKQIFLKNEIEKQKGQNLEQNSLIRSLENYIKSLEFKETQIRHLQEELESIKNPKTIKQKFKVIKSWFELNEEERAYQYQSRPVSKVRENIELMNWIEEYFRMIVSEALISGEGDI